mgnify:CR=1 FL=1
MNTPGLFIVGAVITLIVAAAIGLLLYGAVLDGRDARGGEVGGGGAERPDR